MKATVKMAINSEKKHSVRYDAVTNDAAISSVYVMKTAMQSPYPKELTITIEDDKS